MRSEATTPVLIVGNFLSGSNGSRGVCEELALRLPAAGCPVVTASSRTGKVFRVLDMIHTAWRERRRYAVAQVDVFSGAAFGWAEATCLTLKLARRPYVLTLHGGNLPAFAARWPRRVRRLLRSAAAVTTPSRYLIETLNGCRPDLRHVPNGLDVGAYPARLRTAARPSLVWLRAFHRLYNPLLAVRVVGLLAPAFPDIHLTMIGPDKGDGSLDEARHLASNLGVAECIEFVGGIPKTAVPGALNRADVFLSTTDVDNAPVSVIEAMACGLCVVATNVGGVPHLVDDEHDALLVPRDDPHAMASAVRRVLEEPRLAERLSRAGRQKAEGFDWSTIIPQWRSLLTAAARGRLS